VGLTANLGFVVEVQLLSFLDFGTKGWSAVSSGPKPR